MPLLVIAVASFFMVFLLESPGSQDRGFFFSKNIFESVAQS